MNYKAIIFDFDGTLCDTGEGILKSARYALESFGYEVAEDEDLSYFIGPPLLVTFQEKFGADVQKADELVKKYRERYSVTGLFESKLYEGVEALLKNLKADGVKLAIASSKPEDYVNELLKKFKIKKYFDAVCGVSFTADCEPKPSIVARCLEALGTEPADTLLAGDRSFDINGAKQNHLASAGVLWGYGNKFEFIEAGADFILEKPSDIEALALGFYEHTEEVKGIFSGKIITVHHDTVTLPDGKETMREVVEHPGGVAIVALTDENEVLLVRQFRYPYKEIVYEIPAGKLEKGEDPYEAGVREFNEECGAAAEHFEWLGEIYPTPGYTSEIIRLYCATGLKFGAQKLDEDEYLDVLRVPFDKCMKMIMSGELKDAKTIIGILKLKELKGL